VARAGLSSHRRRPSESIREPRRLSILGSTGSIGEKALAVVRRNPSRLLVTALFAQRNVARLAEQAALFRPAFVAIGDPEAAARFDRSSLPNGTVFLSGPESLTEFACLPEADMVVNAVVGGVGLKPTLAALGAGKSLALANKESLVLAGELVMRTARETGAHILPIDSEHSGLFQCLENRRHGEVSRVVLTASGGPFRNHSTEALRRVTAAEALMHPVWPMGSRITIDSATLLNKGFEVLEAHWLFGFPVDKIDVLIHPQSIVHALIEMRDGSVVAQMAAPDMELPVQYALSWPERWDPPLPPLDLTRGSGLEFYAPDPNRFPCLALAYEVATRGGVLPAVLNAADEVAVAAFLDGRILFPEIPAVLEEVLSSAPPGPADSLGSVLEADRAARSHAIRAVTSRTHS
jgi:1-deoxy-D-xylulose-5-phosphate reductoisomerase